MNFLLRFILAIVSGLVVLFVLLVAVELFSAVVHPVPDGSGDTKEEMMQHVANYPGWILAVAVPMWAACAFASVWTARRIGSIYSAGIVGVLLLAALVCNVSMLPYSAWFKVVCLMVMPLVVIAAGCPWKSAAALIA